MDAFAKAAQSRSLNTIKTELDFLLSTSLLTTAQHTQITSLLPSSPSAAGSSSLTTPLTYTPSTASARTTSPAPTTNSNTYPSYNEKQQPSSIYPNPSSTPIPTNPPPAYNSGPSSIATATSLYAYTPTDAGDLALQPHDRILILEYMNADWARGRNERTGLEGIFPRSYVNVIDELKKNGGGPPSLPVRNQSQAGSSGYGNMAVEVAGQQGTGMAGQNQGYGGGQVNGQQQQGDGQNSKFSEGGKKFGKKLGNAAIFGAGASIGSNIVNGIF